MGHFHSLTPKRYWCYANSLPIARLDHGRLNGLKTRVATARRWKNANGKNRYQGTDKLRSTQKLGPTRIWGYISFGVGGISLLEEKARVIHVRLYRS